MGFDENESSSSSREHAPWSINGMGIRCIISSSFADIFFNNCFKNGMLPIPLPREQVLELLDDAEQLKELEIDLASQKIIREDGSTFDFEVDAFRKHCLLNGLDDIGLTMQKMETIREFEAARSERFPWLDGATTRVPALFAVSGDQMPADTPSHNLTIPTPSQWRAEVLARHKLKKEVQQAAM